MIQKIINVLYRNPKSKLLHYNKFGGYFNLKKIEKARKEMEKAAFCLTAVKSYDDGLPIYFLTGNKYLYQTLFCIQSLVKVSSTKFKFYLVDDGSFTAHDLSEIERLLPNAIVYTKEKIAKQLAIKLPEQNFPYLHHKRKVYPHIKKLTDIHIFDENSWKLVLDSDMLFWKEPTQIINWLNKPSCPIYMKDCDEAYGYSKAIMEKLAGEKVKPLINVGAIGLQSETINWQNLEYWSKTLEEKEGVTYFLEQALSAMIIGKKNSEILSEVTYIVNPKAIEPSHVIHHYVDVSKQIYFKEAWKKIN